MQNLATILEVGAEFPIRRDPDFRAVAQLIALSEADRARRTVSRLKQSFTDRSKGLDPKCERYARMAKEHERSLERVSATDKHHIREQWFHASKDYGYIARERGRQEIPPVRHPQFWLKVKKWVGEKEWRRMWSSGVIRHETMKQIHAYIIGVDPKLEDALMRTIDHAIFDRRRYAYDEEEKKPKRRRKPRPRLRGQTKGKAKSPRNNRRRLKPRPG